VLSKQFGAKVVDVAEHSVIVELTAKSSRVEAFLNLLKPFGILEAARTGMWHLCAAFLCKSVTYGFPQGIMAMPRTPIRTDEEESALEDGGPIDASLLPPG
jgi:acetolactate synthase-1/3 small subunit